MHLVHRNTSGRLPTSSYDLLSDDGQVLGFCQVRHRPSHSADLPESAGNHLYYEIFEAHRGRGYGKELMALALEQARRAGLQHVRLTVDDDNPASRHIIESYGAVWLATFRREGGGDTHLFEVDLRALLNSPAL
jgi:predicted acetyltransferase